MESLRDKLFGKQTPLRERLATLGKGVLSLASMRAPIYAIADAFTDDEQSDEEKRRIEEENNKHEIQSTKDMHARMGYNSDDYGNRTTPLEGMTPEKLREIETQGGGKTRKATMFDKAGFAIDKAINKTGEFVDKAIHGNKIEWEREPETMVANATNARSTAEAAPEEDTFDTERFRKGITYNETRGSKEPYKAVGPTKDLGKYQASPATLKGWSKAWLGKEYTPEEFLNDPDAQERFFEEFVRVAKRLNLTHEQAAVAWHRGWGELGTGDRSTRDQRFLERLNAMMDEDISRRYVESFAQGVGSED